MNSVMKTYKLNPKGFSIVEIIIVVTIIGLLVLLISNLPTVLTVNTDSRNSSIAMEVANKKMDELRRQTYSNLTNGTAQFSDSSLDDINKAAATLNIEDCPVTICTNNEEAKLVTIEIAWNEANGKKTVNLETIIAQGGMGQ